MGPVWMFYVPMWSMSSLMVCWHPYITFSISITNPFGCVSLRIRYVIGQGFSSRHCKKTDITRAAAPLHIVDQNRKRHRYGIESGRNGRTQKTDKTKRISIG